MRLSLGHEGEKTLHKSFTMMQLLFIIYFFAGGVAKKKAV